MGGIHEVDKTSCGSITRTVTYGSITRTVTYYPAAGAMRIGSTLYYTLKDHLGSASVITNASGVTVSGGEQRYYPYGESRLTATMLTDKLFTGQREITGLGIYHYGARFYSPKLGRFIQPDTIVLGEENPQAWNRYSYVFNNPIGDTDPSGHCPTAVCGGLGSTPDIHVSSFQPPQETGTININTSGIDIFSPIRSPLILIDVFNPLSDGLKILFAKKKDPQANKKKGDDFRDKVAEEFEKHGRVTRKEVVKKTPLGIRRIDIEVQDKQGNVLGGIETKSGNSRYTSSQRAKDAWLKLTGYIVQLFRDK